MWISGNAGRDLPFLTSGNRATTRANTTGGLAKSIVHLAIAIVVHAIAKFWSGLPSDRIAIRFEAIRAAEHVTGTLTSASAHRTHPVYIEPFVDETVAVIIDSIASFHGIGMDRSIAIVTIAAARRVAIAIFVKVFVCLAIAVVVLTITQLPTLSWLDQGLAVRFPAGAIDQPSTADPREFRGTRCIAGNTLF